MSVQTEEGSDAIVAKAIYSVKDIATLPDVTVKIINVVEDPDSTPREIKKVIRLDPALSAKVLKVVNSSFYGLPGQVADVERAAVLLGASAIKNIAIAASLVQMFDGRQHPGLFHAKDLWRHCLAVGVAAKSIARFTTFNIALDEVFLAGLIHDLGLLVERQVFPEDLAKVSQRCCECEHSFLRLEREIIGATHQILGEALMTKWQFPQQLRAAAGAHHNPKTLPGKLQPMVMILRCADVLCCQEKLGLALTAHNQEISQDVLSALAITNEQIKQVREELAPALQEAESVLGI